MGGNRDIQAVDSANATSFADLAAARRSIRRYLPVPIPRVLIDSLLETAVTAASAHNRQPWRFLVIETQASKEKLARAMGERLRADRSRDGDPRDAVDADVARSYARLTGAPVLVVMCMSMIDMDRYDDKRNHAERLMATQGTAMAAQNLLLAAHAAGLGACWMCAPLFCQDTVAAALELPSDWEPQAIITLGYPADQGKPFRRRPLGEVARYEKGAS
jgi:coenzyme F420-0:L-glutamate ligase / coenzyme F420-1:gamma-L-glutamate ligase